MTPLPFDDVPARNAFEYLEIINIARNISTASIMVKVR